MRQIISSLSSQ